MVRTNEIARFVNNYVVIALNTQSKLTHCCYPGWRLPLPSPCLSFTSKLRRTVSFSGDGPERSLRHLRAMAAACRTDGHVDSSCQNLDGIHSSTLRARSSSLACSAIFHINRIITFIHIILYGYIPISKNSISGGRIWLLLFSL